MCTYTCTCTVCARFDVGVARISVVCVLDTLVNVVFTRGYFQKQNDQHTTKIAGLEKMLVTKVITPGQSYSNVLFFTLCGL